MKKTHKTIQYITLIFALLALSSCVNTGLKVINGLANPKEYTVFKDVSYTDNTSRLDIYLPKKQKATATIVFFYGGCWGYCTKLNKSHYLFVAETLTKQGYAVVISDFRQYPQVKFDEIIKDSANATVWVTEHLQEYGIDNDNVFLMGHSSGAHIAAMLANNEHILGEYLSEINGFIGLAGPYDFYPFTDDYMYTLFSPENDYFNALPINFINGNEPPQLLLHGLKDKTVYIHNPNNLAKKLQENGIDVTKILIGKTSHAKILVELSKPFRKNSLVLKNIIEFINQYSQ